MGWLLSFLLKSAGPLTVGSEFWGGEVICRHTLVPYAKKVRRSRWRYCHVATLPVNESRQRQSSFFFSAENAFWGFVRQSSTKTLCQTFNQPPNWMSGLMSSLLLDYFFPEWNLTLKKKTTLPKKHEAFLLYFVICYREANWRYSNCIHLLVLD